MEVLRTERNYIKANREALAARYPGKYLVIKGEEVLGAYDSHGEGVDAGINMLDGGPFLVRSVDEPDDPKVFVPTVFRVDPVVADT